MAEELILGEPDKECLVAFMARIKKEYDTKVLYPFKIYGNIETKIIDVFDEEVKIGQVKKNTSTLKIIGDELISIWEDIDLLNDEGNLYKSNDGQSNDGSDLKAERNAIKDLIGAKLVNK